MLDAGVNLLFTAFWYKHEVVPAQELRGLIEPTVMYGPLCMNIDVMRDAMQFPPLSVGDRLVFATSAPTTSPSGCSSSRCVRRW